MSKPLRSTTQYPDPPTLVIPTAKEVHVAVVLDRVNIFFLKPGTDDVATAILVMDLTTLKALQKDINTELASA